MPDNSDMIRRYTLAVMIEFPESVDLGPADLMENTTDALHEWDYKGRLFNGKRLADGSPCLLGSSVSVTKTEKIRDPLRFKVPSDAEVRDRNPFWDKAESDTNLAIAISEAMEREIEDLRQMDAKLWDLYHETQNAKSEAVFRAARTKLRRLNSKLLARFPDAKAMAEDD